MECDIVQPKPKLKRWNPSCRVLPVKEMDSYVSDYSDLLSLLTIARNDFRMCVLRAGKWTRSSALGAGSHRFESCRPDQTTFLSGVWRTQGTRKEQTRCYPAKNAGDRYSMLLCAIGPLASCFLHVGHPWKPRPPALTGMAAALGATAGGTSLLHFWMLNSRPGGVCTATIRE